MITFNYCSCGLEELTARSQECYFLLSSVLKHKQVEKVTVLYKHSVEVTIEEQDYRALQLAIHEGKLNHEDWEVIEEYAPESYNEIQFNEDGSATAPFESDFLSFCGEIDLVLLRDHVQPWHD